MVFVILAETSEASMARLMESDVSAIFSHSLFAVSP